MRKVHLTLPAELITLLEVYQIGTRSVSMNEVVRRLLESHPDLTALAHRVYDVGKSTSPP